MCEFVLSISFLSLDTEALNFCCFDWIYVIARVEQVYTRFSGQLASALNSDLSLLFLLNAVLF